MSQEQNIRDRIRDFIRSRLRQAREETGLSQRRLAELFNATQSSISGFERGRAEASSVDLALLSQILGKPITYFYPGADPADLTEVEQQLLQDYRSLSCYARRGIITWVRMQAYISIQESDMKRVPEEDRDRMAYDAAVEHLGKSDLDCGTDADGQISLDTDELRILFEAQDPGTKKLLIELIRRLEPRR